MHYYPMNIADYKAHTGHLTHMEDLAYRRLLDFYYLHETGIENDIKTIAKKILMIGFEEEILNVLNEFFELNSENLFFNKRANTEINEYKKNKKNKSKAGKASAKKRLRGQQLFNTCSTDRENNDTVCLTKQNHETEPKPETELYIFTPDGEKKINSPDEQISTLKPMTDDWQPSEATLAMIPINWPDKKKTLADELFRFKMHYQAEGRLKADWDKQFQLWLSNSNRFDTRGPTAEKTRNARIVQDNSQRKGGEIL